MGCVKADGADGAWLEALKRRPDLGPNEGRVDLTWLTLSGLGLVGRFATDIACERAPASFRVASTEMSPPSQVLDEAREFTPSDWSLPGCS